MSAEKPAWLQPIREFCRSAGIEVCGWGSDTLVVKAESADRAKQVASKLRPMGFEPMENEDDAKAGLLLLSRDPATTRAKQKESWASADVSQRPVIQRVASFVEVAFSIWCLWYSITTPKSWVSAALGLMLLWDASRMLGWGLQMTLEELRVRRYFQWTAIPWTQIRAVEASPGWGRGQETIALRLASEATLRLGAFDHKFARILRDRLHNEIAQRRRDPK